MRILHLSTEKGFRGGERQLVRIHQGILEAGEESFIVCRDLNDTVSGESNAEKFSLSGLNTLLAPWKLKRVIGRINPDIIHCHDSRALTLAAVISKSISSPIIFSRKTVFPIKKNQGTTRKYHSLSAVIAVSEASAEVVRTRFPEIRISVIHDGVTVENGYSRSESRTRLGLSPDETLFASVGYFTSEKNPALLLKCADILKSISSKYRLLLIGAVDEEIRESVSNHPAIISTGVVEHAENYYSAFDCYLSTSTKEGLGSALLDAVIRDIPVVALNSGGSRDIFAENDLAHCETESQLLDRVKYLAENQLANDPSSERGERCRNEFSVEQLVQNHLKLYRELLT